MTIERISLLRNVGQFDNVSPGAQVPLTPFSVIYAENGRGNPAWQTVQINDAELVGYAERTLKFCSRN